jgi:Mn-dependent DtxR family transcriptional regulator
MSRPKGAFSRAEDVLTVIKDHIEADGVSPTLDQIAATLEMSRSTAHWYVLRLEDDGYIRRSADRRKVITVRRSRA